MVQPRPNPTLIELDDESESFADNKIRFGSFDENSADVDDEFEEIYDLAEKLRRRAEERKKELSAEEDLDIPSFPIMSSALAKTFLPVIAEEPERHLSTMFLDTARNHKRAIELGEVDDDDMVVSLSLKEKLELKRIGSTDKLFARDTLQLQQQKKILFDLDLSDLDHLSPH